MPVSTTRHRLQFAAAILGTVGAVYAFSRAVKPPPPPPVAVTPAVYVPAPPIVPRVDPPLEQKPAARPVVSAAFLAAVREADLGAMERLFTPGMVLDGTLGTAAATGKRAVVAWLLDHGADVHQGETDDDAPVLAGDAYPDVTKLLLDRGAAAPSIDAAAIAGAPNAVARALAQHASPNGSAGQAGPLHHAIASTNATSENRRLIVEKLLAAGADPNNGDGDQSPLVAVVEKCESSDAAVAAPPCLALVKVLTAHGARANADAIAAGLTVYDAARGPVLDAILAAPLEPGATAVALTRAEGTRDASVVKKIVAKGVAWTWRDGEVDAALPLVRAIEQTDFELARSLLDAGAPAEYRLSDGRTPLGVVLEKLSAFDPREGALLLERLLARGAVVNRRLPDGRTPLFAAAEAGDARVVTALADHGARINELVLDETALDAAERSGQVAVARVLHARGGRRAPKAE